MTSKTRSMLVPLMALLLPCCGPSASSSDSLPSASGHEAVAAANHSALYDPPMVTLLPGNVYEFAEGPLTGSGQKFHSDYAFRRAVIIGSK